MIIDMVHLLFRIRIHNLKLRIRILQKVSDPYGSGPTTLGETQMRGGKEQQKLKKLI
jgi:hypothetical protein